jgi:hypothetical protein
LPSQIREEAGKKPAKKFFRNKSGKRENQENKKDFFGRIKKALIFALPIEKRETEKLLNR